MDESRQLIDLLRNSDLDIRYIKARNEGHGFRDPWNKQYTDWAKRQMVDPYVERLPTAPYSTAAVLFDDLDYVRRTDVAVAAYTAFGDEAECRRYALLDLSCGTDRAKAGIVPFSKLDKVVFGRDDAVQLCCAGNAGFTVADGNRHVEATTAVARGASTMLAVNYDAVLFQVHIVPTS